MGYNLLTHTIHVYGIVTYMNAWMMVNLRKKKHTIPMISRASYMGYNWGVYWGNPLIRSFYQLNNLKLHMLNPNWSQKFEG